MRRLRHRWGARSLEDNLIRANVPERVAMLLTGHKSRAIFDRYNIIHEQELLDAGDQLVGGPTRPAPPPRAGPPPRATHHRIKGARPPDNSSRPRTGWCGGSPDTARLCAGDCIQAPEYGPARDRGTRGDGAGRRGRPRARTSPDRGSTPALRPLVSARDQSALRRPGPRDRSPRSANTGRAGPR